MNMGKEMRDFIKEAEKLLIAARHDLNMGDYYSVFKKLSCHGPFNKGVTELIRGAFSKQIEMLNRDVEKSLRIFMIRYYLWIMGQALS